MKPSNDIDAVRGVVDIMTGGWRAQALYTAVKLEIPDLIENGHVTLADLAQATGAAEDGIRRLMRLLVADGVFTGSPTCYANTPTSRTLCEGPDSLNAMCILYGEQFYKAWDQAHQSISSLSSGFDAVYNQPLYEYLGRHPDVAQRFQRTMNAGSMFFRDVPKVFDFNEKTVVDVGGGGGDLLASILASSPSATGIWFDREHMIPKARNHLADEVGLDRVELRSGDMFEAVPAGGDVYILCRVLAGWGDDSVVKAFRNCRAAMRDGQSHLLVLDRFVDDNSPAVLPALWDLHLLVTTGGRHRTLAEITMLLERAELDVLEYRDLPMQTTAIVATPRT